ncbi:hypothetical protein V5799_026009 [Amblyomma americanum]|uniref:Uncharacterized protein n=1 Tax=Amblyomma americanum TaxID=6943 RepID=A0AAQ4DJT7_AMBAM
MGGQLTSSCANTKRKEQSEIRFWQALGFMLHCHRLCFRKQVVPENNELELRLTQPSRKDREEGEPEGRKSHYAFSALARRRDGGKCSRYARVVHWGEHHCNPAFGRLSYETLR